MQTPWSEALTDPAGGAQTRCMAKISARGAHKVGEVKAKHADPDIDATYTFTLCSDGRVLVKFTRPSGYTTPGLPATISSGYSVWAKRQLPLHLLEVGLLEADIERRGFTVLR